MNVIMSIITIIIMTNSPASVMTNSKTSSLPPRPPVWSASDCDGGDDDNDDGNDDSDDDDDDDDDIPTSANAVFSHGNLQRIRNHAIITQINW